MNISQIGDCPLSTQWEGRASASSARRIRALHQVVMLVRPQMRVGRPRKLLVLNDTSRYETTSAAGLIMGRQAPVFLYGADYLALETKIRAQLDLRYFGFLSPEEKLMEFSSLAPIEGNAYASRKYIFNSNDQSISYAQKCDFRSYNRTAWCSVEYDPFSCRRLSNGKKTQEHGRFYAYSQMR